LRKATEGPWGENSEGGCPHARAVSNAATAELFTLGCEVASALPTFLRLLVCTSLGGRRKRERRSVPPGLVLRADVTDSTGKNS
jgi:hypothetical protein